jgi:hypothetical protein
MPFDALVAAPRPSTISDALDAHQLNAVPWEYLAEHKQAQQRKFGPSFWYRHQASISVALVVASPAIGAAVGASQGFSADSSALTVAGSFVWMCLIALITGTGLIKLRAGAHWEERRVTADLLRELAVPDSIAAPARQLARELPGSRLILGELKLDKAVLDPYLLIETRDERVCLGIWDGEQVFACVAPEADAERFDLAAD